jgi:hypothetical protein
MGRTVEYGLRHFEIIGEMILVDDHGTVRWLHPIDVRQAVEMGGDVTPVARDGTSPPHPTLGMGDPIPPIRPGHTRRDLYGRLVEE